MVEIVAPIVVLEEERIDVLLTAIYWADSALCVVSGDRITLGYSHLLVGSVEKQVLIAVTIDLRGPESPLSE